MLHIIDRASWGARYPDGYGSSTLPAAEVWLHHSVTVAPDLVEPFDDEHEAMRILERIGQQRFGRGISYTLAVMPSGNAYEGHSVEREGAHTAGRNDRARAIVLVGNYEHSRVTAAQVESVAQILVDGVARGWWRRPRLNGGHRDVPGAVTACPGRFAAAAVDAINNRAAAIAGGIDQEDDVTLTDAELDRIADAVWLRRMGSTKGGGVELPDMTAGDRLDAIHRLGALSKLRHGELAASVATLQPVDVAELVPIEVARDVVTELVRRLAEAPPPAAARSLLAAVNVDEDLADEDPADRAERELQERLAQEQTAAAEWAQEPDPAPAAGGEWLPRAGGF